MAFSRAFSTRRNKPDMEISLPSFLGRAASQRGGKPVLRAKISSPVALVSTSNQQVHTANHISGTSPIDMRLASSGSMTPSSSDESDASTGGSSIHSHDTVTDASSVDNSPIATEPEPNHLSCYFKPGIDSTLQQHNRSSPSISTLDTPRLPTRAPSHSKRAHEGVHRKRSIQRMLSPPPSRDGHTKQEIRSSSEIFGMSSSYMNNSAVEATSRETNPFGQELAQLDEVAEEFGQVVRSAERDADAVYMDAHGLEKFGAVEYLSEIEGLMGCMFEEEVEQVVFEFF